MTRKPLAAMAALALAGTALAGCSSDEADDADDAVSASPDAMMSPAEDADDGDDGAMAAGAGSAKLEVGDQTYEFDNFVCAFGYDNTQSTIYSFSSNSIQTLNGVRSQMQLDVADPSGDDALTGPDTEPEIHVDDIEDFENPAIKIRSSAGLEVEFEGDDISAEGTFFDEVADPSRQDPQEGSFEATCGADSLR